VEAAIAAALLLTHHAGRPEAHLGVAADRLDVGRRGVDGDPVMTRCFDSQARIRAFRCLAFRVTA